MNKVDICANESIKQKEFLLIDENGESMGQISKERAFEIASEKSLDLVQVNLSPCVVKLLKLDKYAYQLDQIQKEKRRKQTIIKTKTIFLKLKIGFDAKQVIKKKARSFFQNNSKVIFTMKLKKKQRLDENIKEAQNILQILKEDLIDVAVVTKEISVSEGAVSMILSAKKKD